jgi:hypothetical protein
MSDPPVILTVSKENKDLEKKERLGLKMTNTKVNKCKDISCTHSATFAERWVINANGSVTLKHGQKWHFCTTCDKVVHKDYIRHHEVKCASFYKMQENCIAKNHYGLGLHSEGIACNM